MVVNLLQSVALNHSEVFFDKALSNKIPDKEVLYSVVEVDDDNPEWVIEYCIGELKVNGTGLDERSNSGGRC